MARTTMNDILATMQAGFAGINARLDAQETRIAALEESKNSSKKPSTSTKGGKGKGKAKELVEFTKHDGTVVMVSPKQAEAWTKYRDGYKSPEERKAQKEANLAKWEADCKSYKPSKALVDAIKADRTKVTFKVAKDMGFKGTKETLKALKEQVLAK